MTQHPTPALLILALALPCAAQSIITTVAGTGVAGFSGDGGPAPSATLNEAVYVAVDPDGNLYIADQRNHRIRRVTPDGLISTIAGTGAQGYSGDGGPATAASLNGPTGLCLDGAGSLFIGDVGNNRIRRVSRSGIITTAAGNGTRAHAGDGGPATSASLFLAIRCAVDSAGNLYISDQGAHRIRRVDPGGTITTVAGTGVRGFSDGGLRGATGATAAALDNPTAVAVDAAGNVLLSDQFNHRIRRVGTNGTITTIAGTGVAGFSGDGGPATAAQINFPGGLIVDQNGDLFFADDENFRVRKIAASGVITTIAGNGVRGFSGDGGPATAASLNGQFGVALDGAGNLYFADTLNHRIRKVSNAGASLPATFTSAGVTNGASFVSGVAPGGIVTIFGRNLGINVNGVAVAQQVPLPTRLAGVSVTFDGTPAPLFAVVNVAGNEQINLQAPFEIAGRANTTIVVNNGRTASAAIQTPVQAAQPGVFVIDGTNGAILHGADNSLVTPSSPAALGETVVIFATGLGSVSPPVATGSSASTTTLSSTAFSPTVTIGGSPAQVLFSGLAPGFVALYQVNITVPPGAPSGSVDVVLTANGVAGKAAKMSLGRPPGPQPGPQRLSPD